MKPTSHAFKEKSKADLSDAALHENLGKLGFGFPLLRMLATSKLPEFEELRDHGRDIKNHVLQHLDYYLETFETNVSKAGGKVHWCIDADAAREAVVDICKSIDAKLVTKGKSMVTEEIGLNDHLIANGIQPFETDLGEYIIQLRDEPPSHIVGPAIHLNKDQVAETFRAHHKELDGDRPLTEVPEMVHEARQVLRQKYLDADVGITGANLLIAETGSTVIVTNEGNGDLSQCLPKVHIVVTSIEKVVPTIEDAATILRLLARSATGQEMSTYTTFSTGPKRAEDVDGPEQFHVILLDNGRSDLLDTEFREVLRCIRCGACMNHCPVYTNVGGHAYGWVYGGPIGAVLTPAQLGLEEAKDLPNASTFCGRCEEVCPMRIPLPKMMRYWREREHQNAQSPVLNRWALAFWSWFASHPGTYHLATGTAMRVLNFFGRKKGYFKSLPFAGGWTQFRDFPAPENTTFQAQWLRDKEGRSS